MTRGLETFITERDTAAKDSSPLAANILDNSLINQSLLIAVTMKSFVASHYRNGITFNPNKALAIGKALLTKKCNKNCLFCQG